MIPLPGDSELLSQLGFSDPAHNALALDAADGDFRSAVHTLMQQRAVSTAETSEGVLEAATVTEDCVVQRLDCCYYGYTVLVLCCIGQVCVYPGTSAGMTWVVDGLQEDLGCTRGRLSTLYMLGTLGGALLQPRFGQFVDTFGAHRAAPLIGSVYCCSLLLLSVAWSQWLVLVAWCVMRGSSIGGLTLACNVLVQAWFKRKRGIATSVVEAVNALVAFGAFSVFCAMLVSTFGWRWAYRFIAVGMSIVFIPLALLLARVSPESVGMLPDGDCTVSDEDGAVSPRGSSSLEGATRKQALRSVSFWAGCAGMTYFATAAAGIFFHMQSIARVAGLDAQWVAAVLFPSWAVSRFTAIACSGPVIQKMPLGWWLAVGTLLLACSMVVLAHMSSPAYAVLFGVLLGCGSGVNQVVFKLFPVELFGRRELGAISGVLQVFGVAGTSLGPWVLGLMYDATGSYWQTLYVLGFVGLVVSVFQLRLQPLEVAPVDDGTSMELCYPELQ